MVFAQADFDEATGLLNGDVKHENGDTDANSDHTDIDNLKHQIEIDENDEEKEFIYEDARSIESCNLQVCLHITITYILGFSL